MEDGGGFGIWRINRGPGGKEGEDLVAASLIVSCFAKGEWHVAVFDHVLDLSAHCGGVGKRSRMFSRGVFQGRKGRKRSFFADILGEENKEDKTHWSKKTR